jgi:oxygen-dependent protoporphyrinogen oxidase
VATAEGSFSSRKLVLACPPAEAARLLGPLDARLGEVLSSITLAPVAVVHMGFPRRVPEMPDGFGLLAPRGEGVRALGVLFPSRLFGDRTPPGGDLFSGFVGGMTDPGAMDLPDDDLLRLVTGDLAKLVGVSLRPDLTHVVRAPAAIPQLTLGHLERMAEVRERLQHLPGLLLAGNYLKGVGIKDAVASGFEAAAALGGRPA